MRLHTHGRPGRVPGLDLDGNLIETTAGGNWYQKTCDGVFYGAVYIVGPPDVVDPAFVAAGVLKRMNIPTPQVALSPTGDQIVNLPSWFWIPNWNTLTGTATVGGVTVRVDGPAELGTLVVRRRRQVRLRTGHSVVERLPTRTQACTHTWLRSSAAQSRESYRLEVSVVWDASVHGDRRRWRRSPPLADTRPPPLAYGSPRSRPSTIDQEHDHGGAVDTTRPRVEREQPTISTEGIRRSPTVPNRRSEVAAPTQLRPGSQSE